jgi:hypothetical protein
MSSDQCLNESAGHQTGDHRPADGRDKMKTTAGQQHFMHQRSALVSFALKVTYASWSFARTNSSTVTASRPAHCNPQASLTRSGCSARTAVRDATFQIIKGAHHTSTHHRAMEVPLQQQVNPPANPLPAAPDDVDVLRLLFNIHI